MELQRERMAAVAERLVRRACGAGEQFGAGRQVEGVAVPVQHLPVRVRQGRERRAQAGFGRRDRPPANLARARIDARARRRRDQLRAQAGADHGPPRAEPLADDRDLGLQPRIGLGFIDADRPAQHHQQVRRIGRDQRQVVHAGLEHADLVPAVAHGIGNHAGMLERHMLDYVGAASGLGHRQLS
ncbi:hypothetical protein D3C72_1414630 [compost metagenome]